MKTKSDYPELDLLAKIYMESDWKLADADNSEEFLVSKRFKRKIDGIILFEKSLLVLRKIAVVLLVFLIGTGTLIVINEEVRATVIRFFRETFDTHTEFHDNLYGDDYDNADMVYVPTWIPEGYNVHYYNLDSQLGFDIVYYKMDGTQIEEISYSCNFIDNSGISVNTEMTNKKIITIDGKEVEYYESYDEKYDSSIIWNDKEGRIVYFSGKLGIDEFSKMFSGLQENSYVFKEADEMDLGGDFKFASKSVFYDEGRTKYIYINYKTGEILNIEEDLIK
ncbi:MAG: DUF4367 domain-containing protein [Lachnospiraceae bacterium]|nr:DUF4367 domain-containing protein [Lachnospiraceae bacterium]